MVDFKIEVGISEGSVHVGVQPPLGADLAVIIDGATHPIWRQKINDASNVQEPELPNSHTELSFEKSTFGGVHTAISAMNNLARGMAAGIREQGHTVLMDERPKAVRLGDTLFAAAAQE
ncbi:MAG TPA: hypothetical protein VJC09_01440 [Candidatus Saccharimonadales bacterium]|nr:hypothetical protein [Candidatus Saccharimonadales bacterium]